MEPMQGGRLELSLQEAVEQFHAALAALPIRAMVTDKTAEAHINDLFTAWPYMDGRFPFHRFVYVSPVADRTLLPAWC